MAPPLPLPQTLEELAAKQQEDQDVVIATLNSLSEENQTARDERAEDRATLKNIVETLQKLQGQLADTTQQQRAQNLAILRLEGRGAPQLSGLGILPPPAADGFVAWKTKNFLRMNTN
jgi:hypothetical protein